MLIQWGAVHHGLSRRSDRLKSCLLRNRGKMTNYIIYSVNSVLDIIVQMKINCLSTVKINAMFGKKHTKVMNKILFSRGLTQETKRDENYFKVTDPHNIEYSPWVSKNRLEIIIDQTVIKLKLQFLSIIIVPEKLTKCSYPIILQCFI